MTQQEIPVFGEKIAGVDYQYRYGVYGIVSRENKSQICLVQAPNGAFFSLVEKLKQMKTMLAL